MRTMPRLNPGGLVQPEKNTPVVQLEATLRSAADLGHPQAACRLGIELIRCARIGSQQTTLDDLHGDAERAPKESPEAKRLAKEIDTASRALAETQYLCNGVSPESTRNAWRYLFSAASAGNVAAMSRFVRDPGLNPGEPEAAEGWEMYTRNAPEFLQRAIEGGDVRALYQGWFSLSSGKSISQTKTFERDPDKALAYGYALVNGLIDVRRAARISRTNESLAKELGAERAARARQAGADLRAMYFANTDRLEWGDDNSETDVADCWK